MIVIISNRKSHLLFFNSNCFWSSVTFTFKSIIICWLSPLRLCISVSSSCLSNNFFSRTWIRACAAESPTPRPFRNFSFSTVNAKFSLFNSRFLSRIRWSVSQLNKIIVTKSHFHCTYNCNRMSQNNGIERNFRNVLTHCL